MSQVESLEGNILTLVQRGMVWLSTAGGGAAEQGDGAQAQSLGQKSPYAPYLLLVKCGIGKTVAKALVGQQFPMPPY